MVTRLRSRAQSLPARRSETSWNTKMPHHISRSLAFSLMRVASSRSVKIPAPSSRQSFAHTAVQTNTRKKIARDTSSARSATRFSIGSRLSELYPSFCEMARHDATHFGGQLPGYSFQRPPKLQLAIYEPVRPLVPAGSAGRNAKNQGVLGTVFGFRT